MKKILFRILRKTNWGSEPISVNTLGQIIRWQYKYDTKYLMKHLDAFDEIILNIKKKN